MKRPAAKRRRRRKDERGFIKSCSRRTVCALAAGYILMAALVIFNVEPDTFDTFFHAVYWAVVSLTTVGYGDIYPVTTAGQTIAMLSAFIGIAIVALPSGIITAGYMREIAQEADPAGPTAGNGTGEAGPPSEDGTGKAG